MQQIDAQGRVKEEEQPVEVAAARPRILAFAWACSPEGGSETAAGWSLVNELARWAAVTVLVHPRHLPAIERAEPLRGVSFVGVDEGAVGRRLQALARGHLLNLLVWRARYLWWIRQAGVAARRLERERAYDAAIHLTLGIYWLPSSVVDLHTPSVWGPVDGAALSPRSLWPYLGVRGVLEELAEVGLVRLVSLLPPVRRTWRRATVPLVETETTRSRLPRGVRERTGVVNRAFLIKVPPVATGERRPFVLFTSPLETRKAPRLAVTALAHTPPDVRLVFVNKGPEEPHLRRLAEQLRVADRIEFRGKVPRAEMWRAMGETAACVFTGVREVGGAALAEAMLAGTPVIVLAHNGSKLLADAATDASRIAVVAPAEAAETARRIGAAMTRFASAPPQAQGPYLDQESTRRALRQAVEAAAQTSTAASR